MAKARKRKKDKEDEKLAFEIAEIAGVVNYMQKVSGEEVEKKGDLYLSQGRMIAEMSRPNALISEKSTTHVPIPEDTKKTGATGVSIPAVETDGISLPPAPIPEKIGTTREPNGISTPPAPIPAAETDGISTPPVPIPEKSSTTHALNEKPLSAHAVLNVSQDKALFELFSLVRFINGTMNILYAPGVDNRTKTFLIAVLYESALTGEKTVKVRSNDILKALGIHKKNQKKIPEEAEKAGLAVFNVKRKGGTEVTFNEEIFNPNGKYGSIEIDRLIYIYNLSIYQKNNEEKIEERRRIPLQETGKYVMLVSLHLAGFPLNAVTGSLMDAVKGKDPELVAAFWIYARTSAGKIKSPGAYLMKVLENNDTGSLSGEIMEKAKICVMAAQTIVHETYDEPELAFLKNLAQKLSLTDAYYKDRASLTAELKGAGRKLIDECERVLKKLPDGEKQ